MAPQLNDTSPAVASAEDPNTEASSPDAVERKQRIEALEYLRDIYRARHGGRNPPSPTIPTCPYLIARTPQPTIPPPAPSKVKARQDMGKPGPRFSRPITPQEYHRVDSDCQGLHRLKSHRQGLQELQQLHRQAHHHQGCYPQRYYPQGYHVVEKPIQDEEKPAEREQDGWVFVEQDIREEKRKQMTGERVDPILPKMPVPRRDDVPNFGVV